MKENPNQIKPVIPKVKSKRISKDNNKKTKYKQNPHSEEDKATKALDRKIDDAVEFRKQIKRIQEENIYLKVYLDKLKNGFEQEKELININITQLKADVCNLQNGIHTLSVENYNLRHSLNNLSSYFQYQNVGNQVYVQYDHSQVGLKQEFNQEQIPQVTSYEIPYQSCVNEDDQNFMGYNNQQNLSIFQEALKQENTQNDQPQQNVINNQEPTNKINVKSETNNTWTSFYLESNPQQITK